MGCCVLRFLRSACIDVLDFATNPSPPPETSKDRERYNNSIEFSTSVSAFIYYIKFAILLQSIELIGVKMIPPVQGAARCLISDQKFEYDCKES